tara:strand:+ start:10653 stop:10769 length:117 start_codon:yes stop_codon:yes gene_type:complete
MKNLEEKIKKLIRKFPNNYDLGEHIRKLFNKIKKDGTK